MRCKATSSLVALHGVVVALAISGDAGAYCRTAICGDNASQVCEPASGNDCGIPLFWKPACIGYSVHELGSAAIDVDTTVALMQQAFAQWQNADCGNGTTPAINVSHIGTVACDQTEYNEDKGNANLVVYRETGWPYAGQGNTLALTTVRFNLDDGEIFDADLEINASSVPLTVGDSNVQYDLLSIVTHEAGHMLGIAHSSVDGATMTTEYNPGDTSLRDLHPDDMAAICAAYPDGPLGTCDPTPRHGFGDTCGTAPEPESDGCSCSVPGREPRAPWTAWASLLALACVLSWRRRQS
jgi:MYXO-CTERM domain-containing protein